MRLKANPLLTAASDAGPPSIRREHARLGGRLLLLALLALGLIALFMTLKVTDWEFALRLRGRKVAAMLLVGFSIAYSTLLFQTITNNRILTPSVIGFDSLYLLIQTLIVFAFGATTLTMLNQQLHFALNVMFMVLFAGLLYRWLFGREGRNLYFLVLVGMIFGTLFGIAEHNPDILYVVDRDAVTGEAGAAAAEVPDNELVNGTNAARNGKIVYLDPYVWYLANASLSSVPAMIEAVEGSLQ